MYYRRIDDLGRVVILKELRKQLGIWELDELNIAIDGERIIISKCERRECDK